MLRRLFGERLVCGIALLGLVSLLAGCVTNGSDFPSDLGWIKKGSTTQNEVRMLLGEPYAVGNSAGRLTWTYGYYKYKAFGKSFTKELKVYWNDDKTVESFSFNSSFPNDTGQKQKGPIPSQSGG